MKITKKLLTLTSISLFIAISCVSIFFIYSYENNSKKDEVNETLIAQNNILIASLESQIANGAANLNLLRASFGLILKEQALILNANLKNILAVNYHLEENEDTLNIDNIQKDNQDKKDLKENEIKGIVNTTDMQAVTAEIANTKEEIKENSNANLDAINQDISTNTFIKSKLINFQNSIKQSGYDLMITHNKEVVLETLDKDIMNAIVDNSLSKSIKKDAFFNSELAKNFYTLKLKDQNKYHVAFVFKAVNNYKFVFIKNITDVYNEFNKTLSTDSIIDTLVKKYNNLPYKLALVDKKTLKVLYSSNNLFENIDLKNKKDDILHNSNIFEIENNSVNNSYFIVSSNNQIDDYIVLSFCDKAFLNENINLSLKELITLSLIPFSIFLIFISILYTQFARIEKDIFDNVIKDVEQLNKLKDVKLFDEEKTNEIFSSLINKDLLRPLNTCIVEIYNAMNDRSKLLINDVTHDTIKNTKIEFSQSVLKDSLPTQGSMPKSKFFDISGYIVPTKTIVKTFYDMMRIDDENLAFTIGQIDSDKDTSPIIVMPNCINLIRTHLWQGISLSSVYSILNKYLVNEKEYNAKVTAFTLIVNEKTGNYLATCAGGLDPYCISDGKLSRLIESKDACLGKDINTNYNLFKGKLNYQESVVFISNGLISTSNSQNEKYGCKRIESYLVNCYQKDPADILYEIHSDLMKFKGNTQQNHDICAMSIYRKPLDL